MNFLLASILDSMSEMSGTMCYSLGRTENESESESSHVFLSNVLVAKRAKNEKVSNQHIKEHIKVTMSRDRLQT